MSIYLDYNASAPIDNRVLDKMIDVYKNSFGNADSRTHIYGERAREVVENARKQVASLLGVKTDEIFFTSGATESNNIVIQGLVDYAKKTGKKHIITTSIEHKAVLETIKNLEKQGFEVDYINPDKSGRVRTEEVISKVKDTTLLVSVMHVNNETGIIQPVYEIGEKLAGKDVLFHTDATQSCGKLVEEIRVLKYNMLTFSAHKLGGPQGVGVLVLRRKSYRLPPVQAIQFGGSQERGLRPGTVPVALVAGCGEACKIAETEYKKNEVAAKKIKEVILEELNKSDLKYLVNGNLDYGVDTTLNICLEGVSSEALMISSKQYCGVSNGSACTSKNYSPSYVLLAMGISEDQIENSIRISWGADSDIEEVQKQIRELFAIAKQING